MSTVRSAIRCAPVVALLVTCVICLIGRVSAAQEAAEAEAPVAVPSLESVQWSGGAVSFEMLRGKTAVVLVYATWCPICNEWSGEFFEQLRNAIAGKPVVILAINADASPQGVGAYLSQRDFFAPNVLHGYDPSMVGKLKLKSPLFNYAVIGPDGKMQRTGSGGAFIPEGGVKKFSLAKMISESENLGSFELMQADASAEVSKVLWPLELGLGGDADLTKAKRKLSVEGQKELKTLVDAYLDGQLQTIRKLAEGKVADKFQAAELAARMTTKFRAAAQSKQVRKLLIELRRDKQFKQEMAAKNYYDRQMRLAAANPARRQVFLQAVAKRFAGTHYGELAKEESSQ